MFDGAERMRDVLSPGMDVLLASNPAVPIPR
jgi:hypothetical protein